MRWPKLKVDAPWQIVMTLVCGWGAVMLGVGSVWAILLRGPCKDGCVWVDVVTMYMLTVQLTLMLLIWGVVRVVLWEARLPAESRPQFLDSRLRVLPQA